MEFLVNLNAPAPLSVKGKECGFEQEKLSERNGKNHRRNGKC